jgi:RNA polymerase sigma-70 factor, ECF subfamily
MDEPTLILQRVAGGDFAAFESLYDQYHRLVYSIAIRILENEAWAEDVTQNVFTKIWADPQNFRGGNFSGWLARLTRNRTIDFMRSRQLRPESQLPDVLGFGSALNGEVFANIDGDRVRSALRELPEEQRSLIMLGFFSGVTHEELAWRTGVPLVTVKKRIRSGLKKLRVALEGYVIAS